MSSWTCDDLVSALNQTTNNPDPSVVWGCNTDNNVIVISGAAPLFINLTSINIGVPVTTATCDCTIINTFTGLAPVCGDKVVEAPETCDDGNAVSGDGCSDKCILETSSQTVEYCVNKEVVGGTLAPADFTLSLNHEYRACTYEFSSEGATKACPVGTERYSYWYGITIDGTYHAFSAPIITTDAATFTAESESILARLNIAHA